MGLAIELFPRQCPCGNNHKEALVVLEVIFFCFENTLNYFLAFSIIFFLAPFFLFLLIKFSFYCQFIDIV